MPVPLSQVLLRRPRLRQWCPKCPKISRSGRMPTQRVLTLWTWSGRRCAHGRIEPLPAFLRHFPHTHRLLTLTTGPAGWQDELAAVKSEMAAALTTANGILRRLGHSSSASAAVSAGGRGVAARLASPARPRPDGGSGSGARGAGVASGTLASTLQQLAEAVQANLLETARGGERQVPSDAPHLRCTSRILAVAIVPCAMYDVLLPAPARVLLCDW